MASNDGSYWPLKRMIHLGLCLLITIGGCSFGSYPPVTNDPISEEYDRQLERIGQPGRHLSGQRTTSPALTCQPARQPDREVSVAISPPIAARWAVVIGINSFKDNRVPPLQYAERDASGFADGLVQHCGFLRGNVKVLLGEQATQREIRSVLGTFLARNVGTDDLVLIFFSGHGAPEPDLTGKASDGYLKYLVPYDANKDDLFATGIPMSEMATYFDRIEARRIIFFADTCYSGASGGRTFAVAGHKGVTLSGSFLDDVAQGEGHVILTAASVNEVAAEDEEVGHGIFTHYLLEGLAGKADGNSDGQVTFLELKAYIDSQVPAHARRVGVNQHPVMKGQMSGDIVLHKTNP